jgi:hypothetical protein
MRHDFGFVRLGAARLQRRAAARARLRRRRIERLSTRLGLAAGTAAFALVPGRALFALAFGS